jgi:hypothetical protein
MRDVWKVSSQFEYLENWSSGLDLTWQPVKGTLLCIREQSLSSGANQPVLEIFKKAGYFLDSPHITIKTS